MWQRREISFVGGLVSKTRVWPVGVVEGEVAGDAGPRLGDGGVRVEVDFFVLDGAPESFDEDVVAPAALPVHADRNALVLEQAGEGGAGKLRALIGVEDLRTPVLRDRLFHGVDTEVGVERRSEE